MNAVPFAWKLVFQGGLLSGQELHLPEGELTLGAGSQWDINLLQLNHRNDQHCILRVSQESVSLLPLNMRCKINQHSIKQAQVTLQPGQTISVGNCTFIFARAGEHVAVTQPKPRRNWLKILSITVPSGLTAAVFFTLLYASQALHIGTPKTAQKSFNLAQYQQALSEIGLTQISIEREPNGALTLSGSCWESVKLEPFLNQLVEAGIAYRNQVICQDDLQRSVAYILRTSGYQNAQVTAGQTLGSITISGNIRANQQWASVSRQINRLPGLETWSVTNDTEQAINSLALALRKNNLLSHLKITKQDDILTVTGKLPNDQRQSLQQILDNYQQQQHLRIVYEDIPGILPTPLTTTAPAFAATPIPNEPPQAEAEKDNLLAGLFRSASLLSGWLGLTETAGYWSLKALNTKLQGQGVDENYVALMSRRYGVPLPLALKIIWIESRGRHTGADGNVLTSSKGALGIMQLMPGTAKELHVNPLDVQDNIRGGLMYLAQLSRKYKGNWEKVVAAYNWGQGNVDLALARHGENWQHALPRESADYLLQVRN